MAATDHRPPAALVPPDAPAVMPAPVARPLHVASDLDEAAGRPPMPLRPMTIADLVDGGFSVIKARPRTIAVCAAVVVIPVELLVAYSQRSLLGGAALGDVLDDPTLFSTTDGGSDLSYLGALGETIAVAFVAVAVMTIVAGRYAGRDPSTGEVLGTMLRRAPAVLGAWVIVHLAEAIGLLALGIGAAYAMGALIVTIPAMATEGIGPIAAVRRSWQLTATRRWPMVGVGVVSWFVVSILTSVLTLVPTTLALVIGTSDGWVLMAAGNTAVGLLTLPLTAAITCLAYLDLRVRLEGLDLEMDAVAAFERDG